MQLFEVFINNPVKVSVGVLLLVLFGTIAMIKMPKQLTPEVNNPVVAIETRWPGASPHEVEREIVQEQEEQLKSVEGVIKMSSESMDSRGRISLEFAVGTDLQEALVKVNSQLQQVEEYPIDAQEPVVSSRNVSDRAIARFVLTARPPTKEQIAAFQSEHPDLAEALEPARRAMNPGLMVFRLRRLYDELGEEHPELNQLLPPAIDPNNWRRFTENVIEARLERVPGVSDAEVYGGLEEELQIVIDPQQLAGRQLTISDIREALRGQNVDTSGGDFWEGKRRWVVRTIGQFHDPEEVANVVLAVRNGAPVYVGDVAEVRLGYKKPDSISRRYGISSNGLSVQRETGANVLEVMQGLKAATEELNRGVLKQQGLELYQYYDETDYIYSAMGLVRQNIFVGGALTMIVLMLFLHRSVRSLLVVPLIAATAVAAAWVSPWFFAITLVLIITSGLWFSRGALVVGLAIPTSIVGTFLLLGLMGRSLNVISLAGLAFAVGMLVDNAVVVLENIYRRFERGEPPTKAAVRGTAEVAGAVVASTLTTIAVFLPVVFVEEIAGQLFLDIALAISCAVGLSLVISFTLVPTAASRLFGRQFGRATPAGEGRPEDGNGVPALDDDPVLPTARGVDHGVAHRQSESVPSWAGTLAQSVLRPLEESAARLTNLVVHANRWTHSRVSRGLVVIAVLVGLSVGLSLLFWPKVEYLPTGNRNFVFASISPPPGYNLDQLMDMGQKIETDLQPYWDADPGSPESEGLEFPVINYYFFVVRGRSVFMGMRSEDPARVRELIPLLRTVGSQFPGTFAVAKQSSLFERGVTSGRTVDIEISGPELPTLVSLGEHVLTEVQRIMPEAQTLPQPSLDLSNPELQVRLKRIPAAEMGVSAAELGYAVDALVDGAYAGDYFIGGDKIDIRILGMTTQRTQDLENLPVVTSAGQLVPVGSLADVRLGSGPEQINHRERQRSVTIQVTPPLHIALEEAMQRIEDEIVQPLHARGDVSMDYHFALSGTADKLRQTWRSLRWNVVMALLITYLLMAGLFESWLYPLVIIFSIPLGAVGGLIGLQVLNLFVLQPLDVLTMLGFVILIGTVVNNAILIVHQSLNHIRDDGMTPADAIPESVRTRIRPIFITTLTTILGLLPLVLFPGAGSELYRGLGSVVLGGLLVSTVFTLILVPTVFSLAMRARDRLFARPSPDTTPRDVEPPRPHDVPLPHRMRESEVPVS